MSMIRTFCIVLAVLISTQQVGLAQTVVQEPANIGSSQSSPNKAIDVLTFNDLLAGGVSRLGQIPQGPVSAQTDLAMPTYAAGSVISGAGFVGGPRSSYTQVGLFSDDTRGQHVGQGSQRISQSDGIINIRDFGAVGDGTTNDATAFHNALAALPASGGTIYFPAGHIYFLNPGSPFAISNLNNVTIYSDSAVIKVAKNVQFLSATNITNLRIRGLHIIGTLSADLFHGNESQGRIWLFNCTGVEIAFNLWENETQAVFLLSGNSDVKIHHNTVLNGFNPIQSGGGPGVTNNNISVTDNFILASVANIAGAGGADDSIALFSPAGRFEISRNIIDKQGPTAVNFAHGILVAYGDVNAPGQEIIIADNIVRNAVNTTTYPVLQRAAIEVQGAATSVLSDIVIRGNVIYNVNQGIALTGPLTRVSVTGNIIDTVVGCVAGCFLTPHGIDAEGGTIDQLLIAHNLISNTASQAIYVQNTSHTQIDSNVVNGAGNNGIELHRLSGGSVSLNQVFHSRGGGNGIRLLDLTDCTVIGNSSIGNDGYGLILQNSMTRITIMGNTWSGNKAGHYIDGSGSTTITMVGNASVDSTPVVYNPAGTRLNLPHMVSGTARLAEGTVKVMLSGKAIYSSPNYSCTGTDRSHANAITIVPDSSSQFTIMGTGNTDVSFICVGD